VRGYDVTLADRSREMGGRISRESRLPGLTTWARERDWRLGQLRTMANVQLLPSNEITSDIVLEAGASLVAIATGATWRDDGVGRYHSTAIAGLDQVAAFTPEDIMESRLPSGRVVVFDDDHYYMGGLIAEHLVVDHDCEVIFVTPESLVSAYTQYTAEQGRIQRRILERCTAVHLLTTLTRTERGVAHLSCVYTGRETVIAADAIVLVTGAVPRDELYWDLQLRDEATLGAAGIRRIVRVGDCLGPGIIAAAVYSGHLFARTLDTALTDWTPFRRENVELDWNQLVPAAGDGRGPRGEEVDG
jgi:dimethylamine/trimethylamine dehydrogenase